MGVNKATRSLFAKVDTPQKMLDLGEEGLREAIKTIGLFNAKAKNVIALSKMLVEEHGGQVPQSREALEKLPGVGRKTANVVLNVAFGQGTIAVDTHIFRVANRTGLAHGKTTLAVELGLERITPPEYLLHAHHWLILLGRYVCKARKPECWRCVVADICKFEPKTPPPSTESGSNPTIPQENRLRHDQISPRRRHRPRACRHHSVLRRAAAQRVRAGKGDHAAHLT